MKYKITEHFARGEEKPIASFNSLDDIKIFMSKKSSDDEVKGYKKIYRIYEDSELIKEFNINNIATAYAKYAEGNNDINSIIGFIFVVMVQKKDALERNSIAHFNDKNDATLFIDSKHEADKTINDDDLFFIFKGQHLIDTTNRIINTHRKKESSESKGNQKGARFRPTPIPSRPTPPGGPGDYWVEEDDDKDKV